jgi:hypothetical protein
VHLDQPSIRDKVASLGDIVEATTFAAQLPVGLEEGGASPAMGLDV